MALKNNRLRSAMAALLLTSVTPLAAQPELPEPHPDLPDDFQQLLPRGGIPSVDDPVFVSATEAEIDDQAWVLGVDLDGEARAYSLNLLNRHEVVNDRIGERLFAAVW